MTWTITLTLALAILGQTVATGFFLWRASRARRELSLRIHDTALGLDRRCDALLEQIQDLSRRYDIYRLFDAIDLAQAQELLEADVAGRLRQHARQWHAEGHGLTTPRIPVCESASTSAKPFRRATASVTTPPSS